MKQHIFSLFIILSFTIKVKAQEFKPVLTESDWQTILPYLENEDWVKAEKIAKGFMNKFTAKTAVYDEAGIVNYIYLCSVSGQLGKKEISKEQALQKSKILIGKNVITNICTFRQKGVFNTYGYSEDENKWTKCFANIANTEIYMFEYFDLANEDLLEAKFLSKIEGKEIRLIGKIEEITAEGFALPRLKVVYKDVEVLDVIPD